MVKRSVFLAVLLVAVLLVVPASVAGAQNAPGDKVVIGESYVLRPGERLPGNLTQFGGDVTLEAGSDVQGNVVVMGGTLVAAGRIQRNLTVFGGSVDLRGTAVVDGDLATFGGALRQAQGAQVRGRTTEGLGVPRLEQRLLPAVPLAGQAPVPPGRNRGPFGLVGDFVRWELAAIGWALFCTLLAIGALLVLPRHIERVATTVVAEPALSLGLGFLTMVVALLAGGLLLIACGLGLLVWLATLLALLIGWIAVGLWLGQRLLGALKVRTASSLAEVAIGVFCISVLARVPCVGPLFGLVAGAIGLGAVVLTRFGTRPYLRAAPYSAPALPSHAAPVPSDEGRAGPAADDLPPTI